MFGWQIKMHYFFLFHLHPSLQNHYKEETNWQVLLDFGRISMLSKNARIASFSVVKVK